MNTFSVSVREFVRGCRFAPLPIAAATVVLGIGFGVSSAVFGAIIPTILRPVPYPSPETLIGIGISPGEGEPIGTLQRQHFELWRAQTSRVESMAAYAPFSGVVVTHDQVDRLPGCTVSPELFGLLGVTAARGRPLYPGDDLRQSPEATVISARMWSRVFGADDHIIGRIVQIEGRPYEIVGVMPPEFAFPSPQVEFWVPLRRQSDARPTAWQYPVIARVRSGATPGDVKEEGQRVLSSAATGIAVGTLRVERLDAARNRSAWQVVWSFRLASLATLVVSLAITGVLLTTREASRRGSVEIRALLGAPPARLMATVAMELLCVGTLAVLISIGLALAATKAIQWMGPPVIPGFENVRLSPAVLLINVVLALTAALTLGMFPAVRGVASVGTLSTVSRPRVSNWSSAGRNAMTFALGIQLACTLAILPQAIVATRSIWQAMTHDLGIRIDNVNTIRLTVRQENLTASARATFYEELIAAVDRGGGLVAVANVLPLTSEDERISVRPVRGASAGAVPKVMAGFRIVSPDYFSITGVKILGGRPLSEGDDAASELVCVSSSNLARRLFGDNPPLDEFVIVGLRQCRIVGIVGTTRPSVWAEPQAELYISYKQVHRLNASDRATLKMWLVAAGTAGDIHQVSRTLREFLQHRRVEAVLSDAASLRERLAASLADRMFYSGASVAVAGLALLLTLTGILALTSRRVKEGERELGMKAALGASPMRLIWETLRVVCLIVAASAVAGGMVGWTVWSAAAQPLGAEHAGAQSFAETFAIAAVLFGAVTVAAAVLPVLRISKTDPGILLRHSE